MREFPIHLPNRIKSARIDSCIMPPLVPGESVFYNLMIDLESFVLLGEDEEYERTIELGNFPLNRSPDWRNISGRHHDRKNKIDGCWPIRHQALPVDSSGITLKYLGGVDFQVDCELFFDMEVWDNCYKNFSSFLSFEAQFTGFGIQKQVLESEVDLSSPMKIEAFVSSHVEMSAYEELKVDDVFITMEPNKGEQTDAVDHSHGLS